MPATYATSTTTSDQVGLVRDMAKVIDMITPHETVFTTAIGKGKKVKAVDPEWETDELRDADPTNTKPQGVAAEPTGARQPAIFKNHTQIFEESITVTGTAEAVEQYNIKNKLARERMLRAREMKLDVEKRALGNYRSVKFQKGSADGEMAGSAAWITTNVLRGTGGADGGFNLVTGLVSAYTPGTGREYTEALLKEAVRMAWEEGGEPKHIFASGKNKQKSSTFGGIATQYRDNKGSKQATILGAADVYVSDFGVLNIYASRQSEDSEVHIIDVSKWKLRDLRPYHTKPLGRKGDSVEEQLIREVTLQSTNEKGSALIADIDPNA